MRSTILNLSSRRVPTSTRSLTPFLRWRPVPQTVSPSAVPGCQLQSSTPPFHATAILRNHNSVGALTPFHTGLFEMLPPEFKDDQIEDLFEASVQARTVGNNTLRKYLRSVTPTHWQRAQSALNGARKGGLKPDPETMEVYLALLLKSGQLKLSMETYNDMLASRICPHTKTFNHLIGLCVEKNSPDAAQSLFNEMLRRGRHPDVKTYELLMQAHALYTPAHWVEAIAIFDKIQRSKVPMSASTYNAIMKVYLNMDPFEWRIVYNAFYEMRCEKPRIPFGWDTYELVGEALKRGNAKWWLRFITWLDCWIQITPIFTPEYWAGLFVMFCVMMTIRLTAAKLTTEYQKAYGANESPIAGIDL